MTLNFNVPSTATGEFKKDKAALKALVEVIVPHYDDLTGPERAAAKTLFENWDFDFAVTTPLTVASAEVDIQAVIDRQNAQQQLLGFIAKAVAYIIEKDN